MAPSSGHNSSSEIGFYYLFLLLNMVNFYTHKTMGHAQHNTNMSVAKRYKDDYKREWKSHR